MGNLQDNTPLDGWVETEFEALLDAFAANFDERGEVGAALCVYREGRCVADLWGGVADVATGRRWSDDTIVPLFSSTKGATAVCANLAIERGLLHPDSVVADYWPEFAASRKASVTVRQVLSHQAGLPLVEGNFSLDEVLSWQPIVQQLAAQPPLWEPGTRHGYHMRTFGWLVGELLQRVTGVTVGSFLREQIASPLGLDIFIGLPQELEARVAKVVPPSTDMRAALEPLRDTLLLARVFDNPSGLFNYDEMWNRRALHAAELPSSNGIGDARALARLYASCIGEGVDGVRTLRPETVAAATTTHVRGPDAVLGIVTEFGLGFMLGASFGAANPASVFGHAGAGGSLAFGDPDSGLAFAYVMNDLRFDPSGDPRSETLVRATYDALV
jgi:CubicO group peptidase (beta-lactamase class C family)